MFTLNTQKEQSRQGNGRGMNVPDLIPICARNNVAGLYPKTKAKGKLTLPVNPSNGNTMVIGSRTYTFQTTLTNFDGNILIGGTVAETQENIVAAINLTGQPGVQYASATRVNEDVTIADFSANEAIITAKTAGTSGNSIATTETFTSGSNVFDGATLGTYQTGEDYTIPNVTYSPWQNVWRGDTNDGVSPAFDNGENYQSLIAQNQPYINRYWPSSGYAKINVPNTYAGKIKRVDSLGMCIAQKVKQSLTSTGSSASNNVYKIIEIDTNKGVVQYLDGTANQVYLMAFTIDANGVLTTGTPVTMNSMLNTETECDIVKIATDKFLVSYKDTGATNFPKCAVGSVSGVTITIASGVQPVGTAVTSTKLIQLGTDKALLAFNGVDLYAVSISATTPSYGSVQAVTGATHITMAQNGTDKFQLAYSKSSASFVCAGTVATLAITLGTEVRVTTGNYIGSFAQHALVKVDTDKFVYVSDTVDDAQGKSCDTYFLTVSGTTTTIAHASYSGNSADTTVEAHLIDTNKILIVKASTDGIVIDLDLTNNRTTSRGTEYMDIFLHTDNDRANGFGYVGTGNVRWIKIGNFVVAFSRENAITARLQYFSFPVSLSIEVYLNEEYVKTVTFDTPMLYAPLKLNLEVDDYDVAIKLKNPNAQEMLIYPETEGRCGLLVLE